jgi:hypothetical protein
MIDECPVYLVDGDPRNWSPRRSAVLSRQAVMMATPCIEKFGLTDVSQACWIPVVALDTMDVAGAHCAIVE